MTAPLFSPDEPGFPDDRLLKRSLLANATFSTLSGLTLLFFTTTASGVLGGLIPLWLDALGVSLILFAVTVAAVAGGSPVNPVAALVISIADIGWVLGSGVVIAIWGDQLDGGGVLAVSVVALSVAAFAVGQLAGLRRYARNAHGRTEARSRFDFVEAVPARADDVWARVKAIDRIGEFYGDLTDVRVEERDGVLRRTCSTDDAEWSEEVLMIDHERRELVLEFDVSGGRFPVPAVEMVGGWVVTPAGSGTSVHLWYEYTLKWGWLGEIMAALMATFYRRQLGPAVEAIGAAARTETLMGTRHGE